VLTVDHLTRNEICQLLEGNGTATRDDQSTEELRETLRLAFMSGALTLEWLDEETP